MSVEDAKLMCEMIALQCFKESKVEISDAINNTFPFLETLRDRKIITNEMYKESKKLCENLSPVQKVIYEILDKMEEKYHLSVLEILFSKYIMKKYPALNSICEGFRDEILKRISHQANIGEDNVGDVTQLSLEQGTGENSCLSLSWLFPDSPNYKGPPDNRLPLYLHEREEINAMDICTISGSGALPIQQAYEQRVPESEVAVTSNVNFTELRNREEQPTASTSGLKRKSVRSHEGSSEVSAEKRPLGARTPAVRSHEVSVSSGASAEERPQVPRTPAVRSHEMSVSSGASAEERPPVPRTPAVRSHEVSVSSGASAEERPLVPRTPAVRSHEVSVSSGASAEERPPVPRTPAVRSHEVSVSSGASAEERPPGAETLAVRSGANQQGPVDPGNNYALQNNRRRRPGQQPGVSVDFRAEVLIVSCRDVTGALIKRKLEQGSSRKSIRSEDGNWFTPREFEIKGGYINSNNWKTSLTCGGKTLKQLLELGFLQSPSKVVERGNQNENSNKCTICQDGGKLFGCTTCSRFFHGNCHLPYVATKRAAWNCTFCTINNSQIQPCCTESEVLVKLMGPEVKLKCEFLLLKVYLQLEHDVFPKIPNENFVREALQYIKKIRALDTIKKKLINERYTKVDAFVWAMESFFRDPKLNYLHKIKVDFQNDFKKVFAIQ